jgi:hypothetical protein
VVLLKSIQHLGYFPELAAIPWAVVQHIRLSLHLPAELLLGYDQDRTLRRHQDAILQYLALKPSHRREARKIAVALDLNRGFGQCHSIYDI